MNQERLKKGLEAYSNPRNTASGSLKLLDPQEVSRRPLDCFLYYLLGEKPKNLNVTSLQLGTILFNVLSKSSLLVMSRLLAEHPENSGKKLFSIPK